MNERYELEIPRGEPRRLVIAWLTLAVSSLAVSTIFALALSVARTPFVGRLLPGVDLYRIALTLHVDLAVLILFLAHAALLWSAVGVRATARVAWVPWIAFACAALGTVAMAVSPFVASGPALMSNYIPLLYNPVFLAGICAFALALALAGLTALLRTWPRFTPDVTSGEAMHWGINLSILPMLMALAMLGWMAFALPQPVAQEVYFEKLMWAPGHLMQFSYVLIMMVSWLILAAAGRVPVTVSPRAIFVCFVLSAGPVLLAPGVHLVFAAESQDMRDAYTGLMALASWPAATWLGLHLLFSALRAQRSDGIYNSARASLMLSVTLFVFGCIAGAAIASNNVMITGHYHGTVGAVALALMGIAMHLLPQLGFELPQSRFARWQPVVYGLGLLLMALGLVWSGMYNVQRKVPGSGLMSADPATLLTLAVVGAGGLIAFAGTLGCALPVLGSLLRGWRESPRGDPRLRAVFGVLVAVGLAGSLALAWSQRGSGFATLQSVTAPKTEPRGYFKPLSQTEISTRFQQGVAMLHAKQYEYALAAFQRVLKLAPNMPEAHVNMGYSLLGLELYGDAAEEFDKATMLRPYQANAYWGLAIALERSGNLRGARDPMMTYMHLTTPGDPFRDKAAAIVAEWEKKIEKQELEQTAAMEKAAKRGSKAIASN